MTTQQQDDQMKRLIICALERYDAPDLLQMLADICDQQDRRQRNKWKRHELPAKMAEMLTFSGYTVLKADNLQMQMDIEAFVETIYPYYNERQTVMFAI